MKSICAHYTYNTLHTLHYITLHYLTLHYITLHYITLHCITYIHTIVGATITEITPGAPDSAM